MESHWSRCANPHVARRRFLQAWEGKRPLGVSGEENRGYFLTNRDDYELISVFSVFPTKFAADTNFVKTVSPLIGISGATSACTQIATAAEFVQRFF